MRFLTTILVKLAAVVGGIIGGLVLLAVVVALVTQNMGTGIKASLTIAHYGVVATGGIISYGDNVGPDLAEGKAYGDKALTDTALKADSKKK